MYTYNNMTDILTVDQIVAAMEQHNPIVNPDVLAKSQDHTVYIDRSDETGYTVRSGETGDYYHVNVSSMSCDCPAGQHNQMCSHAVAAAKRHVHLTDGYKMTLEVSRTDDNVTMIFS